MPAGEGEFDARLFRETGYCIVKDCFSAEEVEHLRDETESLLTRASAGLVLEEGGAAPRSLNGPHLVSEVMATLARTPRLLAVAQDALGGDVYVHQYKINMKRAFVGDVWEWHSDYWFWQEEDGMPAPQALTAAVFLDDVNDFNGPTLLVPGSHKEMLGVADHSRPYGDLAGGDNWHITTAKTLKYRLSQERLRGAIERNGLVAAKGGKGSVLFFHCNLLHCSSGNSSPWDRRAIFISYNLVANALKPMASPRPDFMASRRFEPLVSAGERDFMSFRRPAPAIPGPAARAEG